MKILVAIFFQIIIGTVIYAQTADEFYQKAIDQKEKGYYQYASLLMDKAIKLDEDNAEYWLMKGAIQLKMHESNLAIVYIMKAISLDSTSSEPYNRAGIFFDSRGLNDSAIYMYNKAIQLAKDDKSRYLYLTNRGTAKLSVMNFEGALKDFKDVLAFNPNEIGTLNNASTAYTELGMPDSAELLMLKVIRIAPELIGPYVNLGLHYTEIDSLTKATEYFDKAISLAPNEPLIYSNRGFTFYKMGKYQEALADINKSLKYYPTNSFAYKNLALVYLKLDLYDEGCNALKYAEYYGFEQRYGDEVKIMMDEHCN